MSEELELSAKSIEILKQQYTDDEHFANIALPRIQFLNVLKDVFIEYERLEWLLHYTPTHKASNCIRIRLFDPSSKFTFYYEIPLMQRFDLLLFLGNNTFNFFEAYPLLISKGVFTEGEYPVKATSRILPHLDLNKPRARYEQSLLGRAISGREVLDSQICKNIKDAFEKFNGPLFNIITARWML